MNERTKHVKSNRGAERLPFADEVTVSFQSEPVVGSGKNISTTGVYFMAADDIRVTVRIGDKECPGRLVRVENHGQGRTGVAVRFDDDAFADNL